MMGENIARKHLEPTWNNKLIYIVHLVGYFHSCMHGLMNIKRLDLDSLHYIVILHTGQRGGPDVYRGGGNKKC